MRKLLLHFRARQHRRQELEAFLIDQVTRGPEELRGAAVRGTVLLAHEQDPMRSTGLQEPARAFDASAEFLLDAEDADDQFVGFLQRNFGTALEDLVHPDLCAAQLGQDHVFVGCDPTPVRYQYCMRRRHDFSDAEYLHRYASLHSRFGIETRGIEGYTQFHIDPDGTGRACEAAGFGVTRVNSVSQLHMASLEAFFAEGAHNAKLGATEDEDEFVDRANSVMWVSDEVFRAGF